MNNEFNKKKRGIMIVKVKNNSSSNRRISYNKTSLLFKNNNR